MTNVTIADRTFATKRAAEAHTRELVKRVDRGVTTRADEEFLRALLAHHPRKSAYKDFVSISTILYFKTITLFVELADGTQDSVGWKPCIANIK